MSEHPKPESKLRFVLLLGTMSVALCGLFPAMANAQYVSGGKRPERIRSTHVFDAQRQIGPIYYPAHAGTNDPERKAAEELAHYLEKVSGKHWEVLPEPASLSARGLFVGRTHRAFADGLWRANDPHASLQLPTDRTEYAVFPTHVSIVGETPQATLTGIYRFLETHAGVRWYAPGKFGEEAPALPRLTLPRKHGHWQPSFRSRSYYSTDKNFRQWARYAGESSHLNVGHNLHRIFTPALYALHPEYWAQIDDERKPPGRNAQANQLDYTNPAIADLTTQAAQKAFDDSATRLSYSLGISDTINFGNDAATIEAISPQRYYHGHPVFSDLVFTFTNAVARQIAVSHPDRFLTLLAYMWAEQLPQFKLEPNQIAYLCLDRSQWYDPERRRMDMELTRGWQHSGVRELGSWEYYLSSGFFIPRIHHQITADSLKFAHDAGTRSLFFESGSVPGFDDAKMWLATRLALDIDADAQALLRDFYHGYYGAAGATMQELAEYCEKIWMEQEGHSYWLKYFYNINQAALFPPRTLDEINTLLSRARDELAQADAPERYRTRFEQAARSFAYMEAASRYYHIYRELVTMPLHTEADIQTFLNRLDAFADARKALIDAPAIQPKPEQEMRAQLLELRPESRLAATFWKHSGQLSLPDGSHPVQTAAPLLSIGETLKAANGRIILSEDFSEPLIAGDSEGFAPQRTVVAQLDNGWNIRWTHHENARLLRHRTAATKQVTTTQTEAATPQTHTAQRNPAQTSAAGENPPASEDDWMITLENQEFCSLFRWIEVPESATAVGTRLEVSGNLDAGSRLRISLSWMDANHKPVGESVHNMLTPGNYGDWQDLSLAASRPEGAVWLYIGIRLWNQAPDEPLHLRQWETFVW